jgi:hypothetical protein
MTTSADIRQAIVTALTGTTDAGNSVHSPFDWPTQMNAYPAILVRNPREHKESWGPNAPAFNVTATIEIFARTKSPAQVGDAGSTAALLAAESLKQQIETELINNPAIWAMPWPGMGQRVQEFKSVDSDIYTTSQGDMPMAEIHMRIEVVFIQTPADFFPIPSVPLTQIGGTVEMPEGTTEPEFVVTLNGATTPSAPTPITATPNFAPSTS